MSEKIKYILLLLGIIFIVYCTSETIEKFADESESESESESEVDLNEGSDDIVVDDSSVEEQVESEVDLNEGSDNDIVVDDSSVEEQVETDIIDNTEVIDAVMNQYDTDSDDSLDKNEVRDLIMAGNEDFEGFDNSNNYANF